MATRPAILAASLLALAGSSAAATCKAKDLKKALPEIFGVKILDVKANEVEQWNDYATSAPTVPFLPAAPEPIDFCNLFVEYTHPGLNDTIGVNVWLPLKDESWNGRFLGQGGLGWAAGNPGALAGGVALGYATADTDAGHNIYGHPSETALNSESWALSSPGNVNLHQLQNFGYRSLEELTLIAKAVTKTYYNKDIAYSYWQGCSTGGRQGLTLAQRYPDLYQGVLAAAPAINWVTFLISEYYAHVEMKRLNYYPASCELDAITAAAINECDELDGVKDGMVAAHGQCKFDPLSIVGHDFNCEGETRKITNEAAQIASVTWTGPIKDGKPIWYGLTPDTSLTGLDPLYKGLARTTCDSSNKNCKSDPFPISADWIRHFILKDPSADFSTIDEEKFHEILKTSRDQYHSLMDSAIPDLRRYEKAGGKIITWHGLADQLIPPNGTIDYYNRVEAITPNIRDYFRHFETPGVAHCFAGPGPFPLTAFLSLVDWVENGKAPEKLQAVSLPAPDGTPPAVRVTRPLCPYPQVAAYKGGDANDAASFECADGFGNVKAAAGHDEL